MHPDAVLDTLDPEQRAVATTLHGPVCVLAGAGTGKTRAITSRIAYAVHAGVLAPQHALAVTFTARAAGEMRTRLRALGVPGAQARTFHSAALRQLQYFWPRILGGPVPQIAPSKASLVREAASRLRLPTDLATLRDLAAEVEWTKVTLTHREDYAAALTRAGRGAPAGLEPAAVARLLSAYEEVKRDRGLIDFEDVLVVTVGLLAEYADVAEQVRGQYSAFVVDEYQDVNPLQQQLLELWLGGRDALCVVGDPSQTIYSFTGATPEHLLRFRARYPHAAEVRLVRDYRSTPQVVGLANALLRRSAAAGLLGGRVGARPLQLVAQRGDGPRPAFREYDDEVAEAAGVAEEIARLHRGGTPLREIAVLFRTNGQSEDYEQALNAAGIPYQLRGGERFFERAEVRQAVLLLRGAARAGGSDADEPSAASTELSAPAADLADTVRGVLSGAGWTAAPPAGGSAARGRWESLSALVRLAEQLAAARPEAGVRDLVAELDERAAAQHAPTVEGVTLASLHAAKGLEWDAVFLVGLTEGLLPISYADTPAAVEEERRLLYVGVTRARAQLSLSWALARGSRGGRRPSRFLDGLRPATGSGGGTPSTRGGAGGARGGSRGGRGVPTCRICSRPLAGGAQRKLGRCEECPASYDEAVFERLREWRLDRARADRVPAYVVFTDATLTAIAEARPSSEGELAALPGVGRAKLDRYAADVLGLVARDGAAMPAPVGAQPKQPTAQAGD